MHKVSYTVEQLSGNTETCRRLRKIVITELICMEVLLIYRKEYKALFKKPVIVQKINEIFFKNHFHYSCVHKLFNVSEDFLTSYRFHCVLLFILSINSKNLKLVISGECSTQGKLQLQRCSCNLPSALHS